MQYKKIGRKRDSKRDTQRVPRQRKPETLQRFRYEQLQRWLDFAASVSFAEPLPPPWAASQQFMEAFLEEHAGLVPLPNTEVFYATKFPADAFFPLTLVMNRAAGAREFYAFHWVLRSVLEWIVDAWASRDAWPSVTGQPADHTFNWIPATLIASIDRTGLFSMEPVPVWLVFQQTFNRLDVARLRRCPLPNCRKIFYAKRANTGACDEHLSIARTQRSRALKRQYEETRQINQLTRKNGLSYKEATAKVRNKPRRTPR
jgi:hypothetical protein